MTCKVSTVKDPCQEKQTSLTCMSCSNDTESWLCASVADRGARYLVKFTGMPHIADKWVAEGKLMLMAKRKLINFKRRHETPCNFLDPAWTIPERLIARRCAPNEPGWQVLVKWTSQGYENCTWVVSDYPFVYKANLPGWRIAFTSISLCLSLCKRSKLSLFCSFHAKSEDCQAALHQPCMLNAC